MNDLEQRVREAFDEVELPAEARAGALAAIARAAEQERAASPAGRIVRPARWRRGLMALAACLVLAAVGLTGCKLYFEETAYVGIDVNPSLELGINRFDLVVSAKALNADGEALLESVNLFGSRYDDAVSTLTSSEAFAPYRDGDAFVQISVVSDDARQSDDLQSQSDACLRSLPCEGSCHAVDGATRDAAAAAGMGVGRYQAALALMNLDDALTLEDCSTMSMKELRNRIAALGGDADVAGEDPQGEGEGHGSGLGHGAGTQNGRGHGGAGKGAGDGAGGGFGHHGGSSAS